MKAKEEYVDAPRETRSKDITVYAIIFLVLLVGAGIFFAVKLLHKPADTALASSKSGIVYDSSAVEGGWDNLSPEEIAEKLNEKVAEGMINISMNTAPYFENGKAEGNVMIVNEDINLYPQQVEFIRNDTQEIIYQSKAIPVGSKIERAALAVELPAGTYECTAMFHNLDPETGNVTLHHCSRFLQSEYRSARTGCVRRPAGIAGSSAAHPSDHACTMPDRRQSRQHPRWPRNPVWCLP